MSLLQHLGFNRPQRQDPDVTLSLVDDVVDAAMEAHHEARVAIRDGNGKVINLVQEALAPGK